MASFITRHCSPKLIFVLLLTPFPLLPSPLLLHLLPSLILHNDVATSFVLYFLLSLILLLSASHQVSVWCWVV